MAYQVLARKYRPRQFSDVLGQTPIVQSLSNALTRQSLHHAYLFTGTHGVGKTTLARIFAKCLNCETSVTATPCNQCQHCQEIDAGIFPDFYEIDAASRTKVEDTRELLNDTQYSPSKGRYKVYLIDEVHMLSTHSFNALLKTLEEPPSHLKFLLATTEYQKLPATILSRCLHFHLQRMSIESIVAQVQQILEKEAILYETEAVQLIAKAANGSMRDALSLLDQCIAFCKQKLSAQEINTLLGFSEPDTLFSIITALENHNGEILVDHVNRLHQQGTDFKKTLADLLSILHQISICQLVPELSENDHRIITLAKALSPEDTQLFYQIGLIGQRDFEQAPNAKIAFEMTLLRMLAFYPEKTQKPIAPASPPKTSTYPSWHEILAQLPLTGAALALAQNCSLARIEQEEAHFHLTAKQKPLLLPKSVQRMSETLSKYFQRPIKAIIHLQEHTQDTPMQINKQNARQLVTKDRKIQELVKTFDAKLVEDR